LDKNLRYALVKKVTFSAGLDSVEKKKHEGSISRPGRFAFGKRTTLLNEYETEM
jgi:hypothetical protein